MSTGDYERERVKTMRMQRGAWYWKLYAPVVIILALALIVMLAAGL